MLLISKDKESQILVKFKLNLSLLLSYFITDHEFSNYQGPNGFAFGCLQKFVICVSGFLAKNHYRP